MFASPCDSGSEKAEEMRNRFREDLTDFLESFSPNKRILILEDFNVKVGEIPISRDNRG